MIKSGKGTISRLFFISRETLAKYAVFSYHISMTMMSFEVEKQSPEKVAQSFFESFISKEENQAAVKSGEGIAGQNLLAEVSESVNENAQKYG